MSAVGDPEAGQWSSASDGGRWTKRQGGGPVTPRRYLEDPNARRGQANPYGSWTDRLPQEAEGRGNVRDVIPPSEFMQLQGYPHGTVVGGGNPDWRGLITPGDLPAMNELIPPPEHEIAYRRQGGGPVYASDLLPYIRLAMEAPRDPYARDPYMHAGEAPGGGRPSSGSLPNPWLGEDVPTRMPLTAAEREGLFPRGPAGPEPPYYGRATPQSPYRPSQYEPEGYYPPPAARAPATRAAEPDIIDLEPRGGGVYGEAPAPRAQRAAPRPRSQPARKRTMVLPGQYPKGLEFKRKGGAVGPPKGKHAAHLVIMIGVMKHRPGAISEKAAKKRGLDAA